MAAITHNFTELPTGAGQSGQALTDYALILFLIAVGCTVLLGSIGQSVLAMFTSVLPGFS